MRDSDRHELVRHLLSDTTERTDTDTTPTAVLSVLVVAAVLASDAPALITDATRIAKSTADRQFVAIAAAHVAGEHERVDALARDHLIDHAPRPVLSWIVAHSRAITINQGENP